MTARIALALSVSAPSAGATADPALERSGFEQGPADGFQRLEALELWRIDAAGEEVLIGLPASAVAAGDRVFVLDRQIAQVLVICPDGALETTFGRRGEGPGELRGPKDLVLLPGDRIGVVDGFPSHLELYALDGRSLGRRRIESSAEMGARAMRARASADDLVLAVHENEFSKGAATTHFRLVRVSFEGTLGPTLVDRALLAPGHVVVEEAKLPYCHWDVAPDGRVFAALDPSRWAVTVFGASGEIERTIERAYASRKRTEAELAARRAVLAPPGSRGQVRLLDHEPDILDLRVSSTGELWVASSRSEESLPEGVHRAWDVFDPDGRYLRRAIVMLPAGDGDEVRFLGDDRVIVYESYEDVIRALTGGEGAAGDGDGLRLVCYRLRNAQLVR